VEPMDGGDGANGANGDITDTKWSHVCPSSMVKQKKKAKMEQMWSQSTAPLAPLIGSIHLLPKRGFGSKR